MNTANNRRRRQSREKIEKVFVELLQTRSLSEIRVSEICALAGVNRTTFYANYTDLFGLADAIRDRLEAGLAEQCTPQGFPDSGAGYYLALFRHIRDNQIFYRTYFKLGYDENYRIPGYDRALARRYFDERFTRYHIEFFKGGLTRIIKLWLADGCRETPEQMLEIVETEYQGRPAPADG